MNDRDLPQAPSAPGCATGCKDGKLRLWDVATSELVTTLDAHEERLRKGVERWWKEAPKFRAWTN